MQSDLTYLVHNDVSIVIVFLLYLVRNDVSIIKFLFVEIIQIRESNIIFGSVYRPPGTDVTVFNNELIKILNIVNAHKSKLAIIAGDYNLDLLKIEKHAPTDEFLNTLLSHFISPVIYNPTRITKNTANSY